MVRSGEGWGLPAGHQWGLSHGHSQGGQPTLLLAAAGCRLDVPMVSPAQSVYAQDTRSIRQVRTLISSHIPTRISMSFKGVTVGPAAVAMVRLAATSLIAVGIGAVVRLAGLGDLALAAGSAMVLAAAVFVGATIWATYLPAIHSPGARPGDASPRGQASLFGTPLFYALLVGTTGGGLLLGVASPIGVHGIIPAAAGAVSVLLARERPQRQ